MRLTEQEFDILTGLKMAGVAPISASEFLQAQNLVSRGLAEWWVSLGDIRCWRIRDDGLIALRDHGALEP